MKATGEVIDLSSIPLSVEDVRFEDYSQVDSSVLSFNLSPFSHHASGSGDQVYEPGADPEDHRGGQAQDGEVRG